MLPPASGALCLQPGKRFTENGHLLVRLREAKIRARAIVPIGQVFLACGYSPTRTKLNGSELASDISAFAR